MSNTKDQINLFHAILLFIMSVGLMNHVIIIPALIEVSGRDAWISILFAMIVGSLWVWLVFYISNGTNRQHIYVWLKVNLGSYIATIFVLMVGGFMLTIAIVTMTDMGTWTQITFLEKTPRIIIVITFILVCCIAANTSILTIAIANGILLPLVIALGYFVFAANLPEKDYSLLFPIIEHGYRPVWQGMIYSGAGMAEVLLLIFLQHRIKSPIRYRYLIILVVILAYLTLGPVSGGIAAFGPIEAAKHRFPAYELWSLVSLGEFVEHVDFFSIYQWLSGAFIRISLALFIIVDLFNLQKGWKRTSTLVSLSTLIILFTFIPFSDIQFIKFLKTTYLPFSLLFLISCSIFLSVSVFFSNDKKAHHRGIHN